MKAKKEEEDRAELEIKRRKKIDGGRRKKDGGRRKKDGGRRMKDEG